MRVEGLSANKTSHFSVILEVTSRTSLKTIPSFYFWSLSMFDESFSNLQVFKVAPSFLMVDIQNAAGDAEEYLKVSCKSTS